jgi:hypothetical protein
VNTFTKISIPFLIIVVIILNSCSPSPTLTPAPATATRAQTLPANPISLHPQNLLQLENTLPQRRLLPKPSKELPDNHISAWFEDYGRYYDADFVFRNGFKRIRIGALFGGDVCGSPIFNLESISPEKDTAISEYAINGVEIVLTPAVGSGVINYTDFNDSFQSKADIDHHIEYVNLVE